MLFTMLIIVQYRTTRPYTKYQEYIRLLTDVAFYDLTPEERAELVERITKDIARDIDSGNCGRIFHYFSHDDTYIRKAGYLAVGRLYLTGDRPTGTIIQMLDKLILDDDFRVRQTAINAAGEIGKKEFPEVAHIFDKGLFDSHHSPRNAVIGSIKKMGEVNPGPVLSWARKFLHHPDKEIRREICHGIELRGRKHPEDILPMLRALEHDTTARVRDTLVHVLGQIAYKKGCLQKVIAHLTGWSNQELVRAALDEIIDVHRRYRNFAALTEMEAKEYIRKHTDRSWH